MEAMDIVGICGSLRSASINRMLLNLADQCLPGSSTLQEYDWSDIPPFNADARTQGLPAPCGGLA